MSYPPIENAWFLAGPTAAGKSAIGIELARQLPAEIISMDSMAVYRGMDIGTAKPSLRERKIVPHHLIDVVDPDIDFSIAQYLRDVYNRLEEIRQRDRGVLFVGGTPLYLKALLSGFDDGPPADWQFRTDLEAEAKKIGAENLHRRLASLDPQAAARVHQNDCRRIIRALEFYEKTGKPISSVQTHFGSGSVSASVRLVVLDWPRAVLHRRINERVEAMYADGLVEEVQRLLSRFPRFGRTASQAVGYQEVLGMLQDELSLDEAILQTQARSRQLARRQLIWLRGFPSCHWLKMVEPADPVELAEKTRELFSRDPAC